MKLVVFYSSFVQVKNHKFAIDMCTYIKSDFKIQKKECFTKEWIVKETSFSILTFFCTAWFYLASKWLWES